MPTPAERNALVFLAALAALGLGVRGFHAVRRPDAATVAADARGVEAQIAAVDAATDARGRSGRRRTGASASARVGADRGDATRAGQADGSGGRRREKPEPQAATVPGGSVSDPLALYEQRRRAVEASNAESRHRLDSLAASVRGSPAGPVPGRAAPTAVPSLVDMDTADEFAIADLPWIGPSLAARIVDDRLRRGPFGSLAGLQRVRGIGPGLVERVRRYVTFSRPAASPPAVIQFRKRR